MPVGQVSHRVNNREALLKRVSCEIAYHDGELYFDRCGRVLRLVSEQSTEWLSGDIGTKGANTYSLKTGAHFAFNSGSASLILDRTAAADVVKEEDRLHLAETAVSFFQAVIDEFELSDLRRASYREQYYFSAADVSDADAWARNLVRMDDAVNPIANALAGTVTAVGLVFIIVGEEKRYRLAVNGLERHAQIQSGESSISVRASKMHTNQRKVLTDALKAKRAGNVDPSFCTVVDIDTYLEDSSIESFAQLVESCQDGSLHVIQKIANANKKS